MTTLYVIRGLPGSGKSTYAHNKFHGLFHVENDMAHMTENGKYDFQNNRRGNALDFCHEAVRCALNHGVNCVVSNVFVTKKSIDSYKAIATVNDCDFKVIRLISQFKNQHDVPEDVFKSMKDHFEDYPGEEIVDASKL